jgi:TolA-binding protein
LKIFTITALLLSAFGAAADEWVHNLFDKEGRFEGRNLHHYYYELIYEKLPDKVNETDVTGFNLLLKNTIIEAEKAYRKAPPIRATQVIKDSFERKKDDQIDTHLHRMLGRAVSLSVDIVDVIEVKSRDNLPRYLIVAENGWTSPPLISSDAQRAINEVASEFAADVRNLSENYYDLEARRTALENLKNEKVRSTEYIRNAANERVPNHSLFLLTDNPEVLSWQVGSAKNLVGFICIVAAKRHDPYSAYYTERDTHGYIRTEIAIKLLESDVPGSISREDINVAQIAEKEYQTANNYLQLDRLDLARKAFQKIVDDYPGTEAAQKARFRLERFAASDLVRGID